MASDFRQVKKLFLAAVELADPAERAAFLTSVCGEDRELREQVEALLSEEPGSGFLARPALEQLAGSTELNQDPPIRGPSRNPIRRLLQFLGMNLASRSAAAEWVWSSVPATSR